MTTGNSGVSELFEIYQEALREGDGPRAIQAAVEIDDASPPVSALLDDFATAIDNDDVQLANTLLLKINDRYDEQAATEEAEVQRAIRAVENAALTDAERNALLTLSEEYTQANFLRSSFLSEAVGYLEATDAEDATGLTDTASQTKTAEENFATAQAENSVDAVNSDADLGAAPTLLASNSPPSAVAGEPTTTSVTVGNVGDAETEPLVVETTGETNASVSPTRTKLGRLSPSARRAVSVEVTPASAGSASFKVVLKRNGTTIGSTASEFSVSADVKTLKEAFGAKPDHVLEAAGIQQAISYWAANESVPGTAGEQVSTDRLQSFITEWIDQKGGNQ